MAEKRVRVWLCSLALGLIGAHVWGRDSNGKKKVSPSSWAQPRAVVLPARF